MNAPVFDPAALKLPDFLARSQGPAQLEPPPPPPELKTVQTQLSFATRAGQAQVCENLAAQLQRQSTETRADGLKALIVRLRALQPTDGLSAALCQILRDLQALYADPAVPRDLATLSVLHPLLKCQAYKWDALQAGKAVSPPEPEAVYLQRLRQLKAGLGVTERAALLQSVQLINQLLPAQRDQPEAPAPETPVPAEVPCAAAPESAPESTPESAPDAEPFDPLAANRLSLQLRARLQRSHSAAEKAEIQAELSRIQQRLQAHHRDRQQTALLKQTADFTADRAQFSSGKLTGATFASWRKLRLSSLQQLARLFAQEADAQTLSEVAQKQLARLGMTDAQGFIGDSRQLMPAAPEPQAAWQAWRTAFDALIDTALADSERLHAQLKVALSQRRFKEIESLASRWKQQQAKLAELERQYQAEATPALRQQLLQAYADWLSGLPRPETDQSSTAPGPV